jgi:hypothetical protein
MCSRHVLEACAPGFEGSRHVLEACAPGLEGSRPVLTELLFADLFVDLFADPFIYGAIPVRDKLVFSEKEAYFAFGAFWSIGAVYDIAAYVQGQVTSDGAHRRSSWAGGTNNVSAKSNCPFALPNHSYNRSGSDETNQTWKKWFALMFAVVAFGQIIGYLHLFHADQF